MELGELAGMKARVVMHVARTMPLIPVAQMEELLVEGDHQARDAMEPVPSAFFEDTELAQAGSARH